MAVHKWWEVQRDHRGKLLPRKPNVWALKVANTRTPDGRVVGVLVRHRGLTRRADTVGDVLLAQS